jgi:hypothetical protein
MSVVTNNELLEAVSSYGESGNAQHEPLVFLTPRLHIALVEHFRELTKPRGRMHSCDDPQCAVCGNPYVRDQP